MGTTTTATQPNRADLVRSEPGHQPERGPATDSANHDKRRSERGAALVEAAIVAPLFLLLIFGIFEFGFLVRNSLVLSNATADAARAAAVAGSSPESDYRVLRAFEHGIQSAGLENLEVLVIYHADGPNDTIPATCFELPVPLNSECNVYVGYDFFRPYTDPSGNPTSDWGCGINALDKRFCPLDRQTSVSAGPDYIGVYARFNHDYITSFFGSEQALTVNRIIRVEPDEA